MVQHVQNNGFMKGKYSQIAPRNTCVINFYFSVFNSTCVSVGPKIDVTKSKYGKFYAGKDKVWIENRAFQIPKASPLKARF